MRKHKHSIPPVFKHNGRLNNSVAPRRRRKRSNAQSTAFLPSLSFFPVKIRANLKHYMPL